MISMEGKLRYGDATIPQAAIYLPFLKNYKNLTCERIAEIRKELGLPRYRFGDNKKYHITIGNVKHQL